jgi:DNA-binding NarL/FixJ family response regulator
MIKVLIADTHQAVRRGLKQILEGESDIKVTNEARSLQDILESSNERNCDVLVLDFDMPKRGGLEMLQKLKELRPSLPIVVMSIHSEEQFASRVLNAGAKGYLTKDTLSEEVVKAVRKAFAGEPSVRASLVRTFPP